MPLAPPLTPVPVKPDNVLRPPVLEPGGEPPRAVASAPPAPAPLMAAPPPNDALVTAPFSPPRQARREMDFDDGFGDDFGNRATVLAGPPASPGQPNRRAVRYDLLAGAALLLALLALVPLLIFRGDPEEMSNVPKVPSAGGGDPAGRVTVELAAPVDMTDKVQLSWKANRELDFAVVVAAEGEKNPQVVLAQRDLSTTVEVEPGRKYCFMIQGTDGDDVYESKPQPLRGATCRK